MANSKQDFPPVRACLFDMDGLLIDSEEIYTLVVNKILEEHGKGPMPWSVKAQLQGRPAPEAGKIFQEWAQLPIPMEEFTQKQSALQKQYFPTTQPLPGVFELIQNLSRASKNSSPLHIALATSSMNRNFMLKTAHLTELFSLFPESKTIVGDDPRLTPGRGKPLPDIYLLALEMINKDIRENGDGSEPEITPEECLVFEDSVPGVEAGRRAGMRVIWCPHEGLFEVYKGREDEVMAGLTGAHKEEVIDGAETQNVLSSGKLGKLNDGWAELLHTLESFPYEKYGIKPV